MKKFFIKLVECNFSCKSVRDYVRFRSQSLFLAFSLKLVSLMTLRASLLRELENPSLSVNSRAELCCELARQLEYKGEYEEARKILSAYWRRIGEHPRVTGLEPSVSAEVLLRAGVLTGIVGSKNQITDAQERAKDLLSESHTIFESQRNKKKIAEAQTELALCYWRTGEISEARDLLNEALSRLAVDSDLKAKAIIRLAIVERGATHHDKAVRILTRHAPLFERINNHTLKGSYHDTLGNALEDLSVLKKRRDYVDRALIEYAASSYHFEQAEHRCYLASVENNLGMLYFRINRCDEAHKHLDRARRIFQMLKDVSAVAQVDETRACVFLQQGRVADAERAARLAVQNQEKTGRDALLAEALIAHGRALARLKHYGPSLSAFRRAIYLSERAGNINRASHAALAAFQEIGDQLVVAESGQPLSGRGWGHDKRAIEHDLIKLALEQAKGSVTHAARNLGISYPSLNYMLRTRYKDLLKYRTPVRRRPRKQ
jgi:tetratricopeptide (TPR) repeat protein